MLDKIECVCVRIISNCDGSCSIRILRMKMRGKRNKFRGLTYFKANVFFLSSPAGTPQHNSENGSVRDRLHIATVCVVSHTPFLAAERSELNSRGKSLH